MQPHSPSPIRPTKKQRELYSFIADFIQRHGYSPSYREIMRGLDYTSVATVALHVNNLIARGHLQKRSHEARSLEVVPSNDMELHIKHDQIDEAEEKWLIRKVEDFLYRAEDTPSPSTEQLDELAVLIETLRILGLTAPAQTFSSRLNKLKKQQSI